MLLLLFCADNRFYTPAWQPVSNDQAGNRHSAVQAAALRGLAHSSDPATTHTRRQQQQHALWQDNSQPGAQHQRDSATSRGSSSPHVLQDVVGHKLDTTRLFYSFEMGGVHFLMLDTECPSEPGSPQGQFVAADLAKVGGGASHTGWDCWCCDVSPAATPHLLSSPWQSNNL